MRIESRVWMIALATFVAAPAAAQVQGDPDDPWCRDSWGNRDRDRDQYCEVREFTLEGGRRTISVDAAPNGGIRVEGWDRNEILVRARVQTWSRWDDDAADLAGEIEVLVSGPVIRPDGPQSRGRNRTGWSVAFELFVPHESNLSLESTNGGISIVDVTGDMDFRTTNGGITLAEVAGDVRGRTTNGGIRVELDGEQWNGRGLDVQTTNGGVTLTMPEDYRAELETGTVNGGFRIDFPIILQGRIDRRRIRTDLNGGGPPIRAVTTNGGVTVRRR